MGHADTVGLHGVPRSIVVIAQLAVIEVGHLQQHAKCLLVVTGTAPGWAGSKVGNFYGYREADEYAIRSTRRRCQVEQEANGETVSILREHRSKERHLAAIPGR